MARPLGELRTSRLLLRHFKWDDLPELASISADPRNRAYMPSGLLTWEQTAANIRQWIEHYPIGLGMLAVVELDSRHLIGQCGLFAVDADTVELGYLIDWPFAGRGYATEASRAVLSDLRRRSDVRYVIAEIHPDNHGSQRVAAKLGMRRVGTRGDRLLFKLDFTNTERDAPVSEAKGMSQ